MIYSRSDLSPRLLLCDLGNLTYDLSASIFSITRHWKCHISNIEASESEIMKIKTITANNIQYAVIFDSEKQDLYSES